MARRSLPSSITGSIEKKRIVWQDPPDLRWCLYLALLVILVGSTILATVGFYLNHEPRHVLNLYLASRASRDEDTVCRNGTFNLCPTHPNVDALHVLPGHWIKTVTGIMGWVGLIDVIICLVAGLSAFGELNVLLFMTLFLPPLTIASKWKLVDLIVFEESPLHETAKNELVALYKEIYEYYNAMNSSHGYITTMNTIMITSGCCGIRGPKDFEFKFPLVNPLRQNLTHIFQLPPACCVRPHHSANTAQHMLVQILGGQCYSRTETWNVNQRGCFSSVFGFVYDHGGNYMLALCLCLIILQSTQSVLQILVLLRRKTKRKSYLHNINRYKSSRLNSDGSLRFKGDHGEVDVAVSRGTTPRSSFGRRSTTLDVLKLSRGDIIRKSKLSTTIL